MGAGRACAALFWSSGGSTTCTGMLHLLVHGKWTTLCPWSPMTFFTLQNLLPFFYNCYIIISIVCRYFYYYFRFFIFFFDFFVIFLLFFVGFLSFFLLFSVGFFVGFCELFQNFDVIFNLIFCKSFFWVRGLQCGRFARRHLSCTCTPSSGTTSLTTAPGDSTMNLSTQERMLVKLWSWADVFALFFFSFATALYLHRVCRMFVADQQPDYFSPCPMARNFILHVQTLFRTISSDGMCASKRGVNKIIREITLERQGARSQQNCPKNNARGAGNEESTKISGKQR